MTTNICIYPKEEEKTDEKLPKHMRVRYWEVYELICLVEAWAHYKNEITSFDENCIAFRQISRHMNQRGYKVTTQDCRRKIRSLNLRYQKELKEREKNPAPKPKTQTKFYEYDFYTELEELEKDRKKWHLFDVIHSSLNAPYVDLNEDERILNEICKTIEEEENKPRDPEYRILRQDTFTMKSLIELRIQNENMASNSNLMKKQLEVKEMQLKMMYSHFLSWQSLATSFIIDQLQSRRARDEENKQLALVEISPKRSIDNDSQNSKD